MEIGEHKHQRGSQAENTLQIPLIFYSLTDTRFEPLNLVQFAVLNVKMVRLWFNSSFDREMLTSCNYGWNFVVIK